MTEQTEPHARRRQTVLEQLDRREAMVLPAAPEIVVGRDTELRYIPDPDLWYLTGYPEPEAVAVLAPGADHPFTLFVRDRDPRQETWTGPRGGVPAATERYGADAAHPVGRLDRRLPELLQDVDRIHFRLGTGRDDVERVVLDALRAGRHRRQRSGYGPAELVDPGLLLDEMRLVKGPTEIDAIRDAVCLTIHGMRQGLAAARDGAGEWEVEAAVNAAFRAGGGDGPGFATIAASGPNACVLHHIANDRVMRDGELLLVDAGARLNAYNGDLTRTFPVGGTFTGPARNVYDIVAAANQAAIDAVRPGNTIDDVHRAAATVLATGAVELGLLTGDPADLVDDPDALRGYYPHRTSHWLGLDVHDVGTYAVAGQPRPLEPGMVLTIEPGLYIPAHHDDAHPDLRGLGVRIEDDILVTANGAENLSADLPTDADRVASLTD
ncbi:MAG TPA: aminopeptidase P N-terminal domain-containing protein [Longimicrobiales bacterium]|nr:aminopeptidase P N-terminal domain-containing protein [Longimicrobiales bacterium]